MPFLIFGINEHDAMPDGGCLIIEATNTYLDGAYATQQVDATPGQDILSAIARAFAPFFTANPPADCSG